MTANGLVKFYDKNRINSGGTFSFTSALAANASFMYDNDSKTKLMSSGSDDATPEVWTITFDRATAFNRIFIQGHNIKSGKIEYYNGSTYVDFSTPIAWSGNTVTSNLFEFNSVNCTAIKITMDTTMIANSQKSVMGVKVFSQLGEVSNNPKEAKTDMPDAAKELKTSNGGVVFVYFGEKYKIKLSFDRASVADMALFRDLKERGEPFFVYLCGGIATYVEEGWRPGDMPYVVFTSELSSALNKNLHDVGVKIDITMSEV